MTMSTKEKPGDNLNQGRYMRSGFARLMIENIRSPDHLEKIIRGQTAKLKQELGVTVTEQSDYAAITYRAMDFELRVLAPFGTPKDSRLVTITARSEENPVPIPDSMYEILEQMGYEVSRNKQTLSINIVGEALKLM